MKTLNKIFAVAALLATFAFGAYAQNSAAAPGSGGSFNPNPANGIGWNPGPGAIPGGGNSAPAPGAGGNFTPNPANGIGWNPGPGWGSPWGGGWNSSPSIIVNAPSALNQGVTSVVGVGYDAQGVWRTVPMTVAYNYNGAFYDVTVLNAWNPWTDMWNRGIDQPAYSTTYYLRGQYYDFYTVLSTGTFYFNL